MISEGGLQSHRVSPYRPGHGYYGSIEGRFLTWERLWLLYRPRLCGLSPLPLTQLPSSISGQQWFYEPPLYLPLSHSPIEDGC